MGGLIFGVLFRMVLADLLAVIAEIGCSRVFFVKRYLDFIAILILGVGGFF